MAILSLPSLHYLRTKEGVYIFYNKSIQIYSLHYQNLISTCLLLKNLQLFIFQKAKTEMINFHLTIEVVLRWEIIISASVRHQKSMFP